MRNILMLAGFLLVVFTGKANVEKDVKVGAGQILSVELSPLEVGTVLILREKKGSVLFSDSLFKSEPYKTSFDLKLLPKGNYFLELDNEFTIQSWEIKKDDQGLEILKANPTTNFKPHIKVENDIVKVLLTNPLEGLTQMEVLDSRGEVVAVCQDRKITFKRTLDFSQVPGGTYRIKIQSGDQTFLKTINIK